MPSKEASGVPHPSRKEEMRRPLEINIQLNDDKGICQGHQFTLNNFLGGKKPIIKRPKRRPAIPERKHAFHYMEFFSMKAWNFIKKEGIVGKQQEQIMDFLIKVQQPLTDLEISEGTGLKINVVPSRRSLLLNRDKIIEFKTDKVNSTGHEASAWGLITEVLPPQEWDTDHFSKAGLYRRGWTDRKIKIKLKTPDKLADNPYNCNWAPMKLYEKQRVFRAERELERESQKSKKGLKA